MNKNKLVEVPHGHTLFLKISHESKGKCLGLRTYKSREPAVQRIFVATTTVSVCLVNNVGKCMESVSLTMTIF